MLSGVRECESGVRFVTGSTNIAESRMCTVQVKCSQNDYRLHYIAKLWLSLYVNLYDEVFFIV